MADSVCFSRVFEYLSPSEHPEEPAGGVGSTKPILLHPELHFIAPFLVLPLLTSESGQDETWDDQLKDCSSLGGR